MSALTLTPSQVAERLGFSERFIRSLAAERKVPCLRGGRGAVRFTEAHVEAIVEHLTQHPVAVATTLTTARSRRRTA